MTTRRSIWTLFFCFLLVHILLFSIGPYSFVFCTGSRVLVLFTASTIVLEQKTDSITPCVCTICNRCIIKLPSSSEMGYGWYNNSTIIANRLCTTLQPMNALVYKIMPAIETGGFAPEDCELVSPFVVFVSPEDKTRQDKTRQGKARQDKTRQDKTTEDKTRQDEARQDKTRQDLPPRCETAIWFHTPEDS